MKHLKETIQKKSENSFSVKIYDYLNSCWVYIGNRKTSDEAYKLHNEAQFDYYLDKRYLLPKGIGLDIKKKRFIFAFSWNGKTLNKKYDSLQQAIGGKKEFLMRLID